MEQTSLESCSAITSTTLLSLACALMREAITSCRRFRISRAEVAAEILMFHRYQKAVAVSNGMMRATSFCQRKSVADLSPRASPAPQSPRLRSEEHTSELQSLMRISYAVFCLKQKTKTHQTTTQTN